MLSAGPHIPNEKKPTPTRKGIGYRLFKGYVHLFHDCIYYRKTYVLNARNIPQGVPLMIVSNHQNSLNDALALLLAIDSRKGEKVRAITRADAFTYPLSGKIFRALGLMPAFRLSHEGMDNLGHNTYTFDEAEHELLNNGTIIIYPEAGHQDKRWLGSFTYGYLRLLFEAAEKDGFRREMFVLPSVNHYSDYFGLKSDILIRFGTPISIRPYYELYREKPRTAQRQVNERVRDQLREMMLHIEDTGHYAALDYLRNSAYGDTYAEKHGYDPRKLPEKLLADKELCGRLEADNTAGIPQVQRILSDAGEVDRQLKALRIGDDNFGRTYPVWKIAGAGLFFALLFPLFAFGFLSNLFLIALPTIINKRMVKDPMFHGTINIILTVFIGLPVNYILALILAGAFISWPVAFLWLLCLPLLLLFVWYYHKGWKSWLRALRYRRLEKAGKLQDLTALRTLLFVAADEILNKV